MNDSLPQPSPPPDDAARVPKHAPPQAGSSRRPYLNLIVSLLGTVAALVSLHVVAQAVSGIRLGERTYLHARCALGDVVIALNTRKALPWLLLALFLPPLVLGTASVFCFADTLVTLLRRSDSEKRAKR